MGVETRLNFKPSGNPVTVVGPREDKKEVLTDAAHTYLAEEMVTAAHEYEHMDVVYEGLGAGFSGDFTISARVNRTNVTKSDTRTLLVAIVQRLLVRPEFLSYLISYKHHHRKDQVSPCTLLLDPLILCGKSQQLRLLFPHICTRGRSVYTEQVSSHGPHYTGFAQ